MFEDVYLKTRHFYDKGSRSAKLEAALRPKRAEAIAAFKFKSKRERNVYEYYLDQKPLQTFEIWNPDETMTAQVRIKKRKAEEEGGEVEEEEKVANSDEEEEEEDSKAYRRTANVILNLTLKGCETYPVLNQRERKGERALLFTESQSFRRYQVTVLTNLLHLSVLRQQWERANTCFGLLIRIEEVDVRSIWPIGLEILIRLEEARLAREAKAEGIDLDSYQLRVLTNFAKTQTPPPSLIHLDESSMAKLQQLINDSNSHRVVKFASWLRAFFNISKNKFTSKVIAPAWRSASKGYGPLFFRSLVWAYLLKFDFRSCKDLLNDLILQSPFDSDGNFYYLLALCYQVEANYSHEMRVLDPEEIQHLLSLSLKNFLICYKEHNFEIPSAVVDDLRRSFNSVGVQNTHELFKEFSGSMYIPDDDSDFDSGVEEEPIVHDYPPTSPSSSSQSPSSSPFASDAAPHSPDSPVDQSDSDDADKDVSLARNLHSLTISPFSQDEFSPIADRPRERHRSKGIDTVLEFDDDMVFDEELSSD